jgi:integrase
MSKKKDFDITTVAGRRKLTPRNDPYYRREGAGHLGFRCTGEDGEGTWMGRAKSTTGKGYDYMPLGRFSDYRDAAEAFKSWLADLEVMRRGGLVKEARRATVRDAAIYYLDAQAKSKDEDGYRKAKTVIEAHLIGREKPGKLHREPHPLAFVLLSDLSMAHVVAFKETLLAAESEIKATRGQKATANRKWRIFTAMLNHAKRFGLIASDLPWKGVWGYAGAEARSEESYRYLTPAERGAIIKAIDDDQLRDFLRLLAMTGARPVELERLIVGDYNKKAGTLKLWNKKTRDHSPRSREIPVSIMDQASAILDKLTRNKLPNAPIFTDMGNRFAMMNEATATAEIDDATAYCFRHSFITDCLNNGVMVHEVARLTGTSIQMIQRTYAKLLVGNLEKSLKGLKFAA